MRGQIVAVLERLFSDRGVDIAALSDAVDLSEALEWDSMDVVDLGMELERCLGVSIPEEVERINSIAKLMGCAAT